MDKERVFLSDFDCWGGCKKSSPDVSRAPWFFTSIRRKTFQSMGKGLIHHTLNFYLLYRYKEHNHLWRAFRVHSFTFFTSIKARANHWLLSSWFFTSVGQNTYKCISLIIIFNNKLHYQMRPYKWLIVIFIPLTVSVDKKAFCGDTYIDCFLLGTQADKNGRRRRGCKKSSPEVSRAPWFFTSIPPPVE